MHQARDSAVIGSLCLELHKLCREKNAEFRILQFHYTQSVRLQKTLSVWLLASANSTRLWRAVDWYVLTGHNSRFSPALSHGNVNRNESSLASFDSRENEFSLKQTYKLARLVFTKDASMYSLLFVFYFLKNPPTLTQTHYYLLFVGISVLIQITYSLIREKIDFVCSCDVANNHCWIGTVVKMEGGIFSCLGCFCPRGFNYHDKRW